MSEMAELNARMQAKLNLSTLEKNPYPGSGVIVGLSETGEYLVQLVWEEGSSISFEHDEGCVFTATGIYMTTYLNFAIVSNGFTKDIVAGYAGGGNFCISVNRHFLKPDHARCIAACSWWRSSGVPVVQVAALRESLLSNNLDPSLREWDQSQRVLTEGKRGLGYCLTTSGDSLDENLLPGYVLPLIGDANQIATTFARRVLGPRNLALAVKFIPKCGSPIIAIVNKNKKV